MIVLKGIAAATVLSVVGLMVGLVLLIPTVATASSGGVEAATGILTVGPSHEALDDIPESILAGSVALMDRALLLAGWSR